MNKNNENSVPPCDIVKTKVEPDALDCPKKATVWSDVKLSYTVLMKTWKKYTHTFEEL